MSVTRTVRFAVACAALASAVLVYAVQPGWADQPFYKGKRITLLINYGAGGPADIEGRLFAKYLMKHLDGAPNIIVQDMDGAGGLVGSGYLGEVAPKDGTMVGHLTGTAWRYINDPGRFRVDFRTYEFIAYQPSTTVYYVRTDVPPGIHQGTDLIRAKGIISGGLGPDNAKDLLIRLGLQILGVPDRHVTSYRDSAAARLALQQGEINFYSESPPSYRSVVHPGIVKEGLAIPVWHDPANDGDRLVASPQVEGLGIPPFHEFYKSINGTLPSGPLWDAYRAVNTINGSMLRLVALPPGSPLAAVDALRAAVAQLGSDTAYAEETLRTIGFVPEYVTGADTGRQVRQGLTVRPEIRDFLADYAKKGGQ